MGTASFFAIMTGDIFSSRYSNEMTRDGGTYIALGSGSVIRKKNLKVSPLVDVGASEKGMCERKKYCSSDQGYY